MEWKKKDLIGLCMRKFKQKAYDILAAKSTKVPTFTYLLLCLPYDISKI